MTTRKMVFTDTSLCTACKACSVACKAWNDLPAEKTQLIKGYQSQGNFTPTTWTYMSLHEKYENGKMNWLFFKHQCFHCADPACMKVCPVGAISKTAESGYTLIDQEKCIGCGYCTIACPWGVPKTDPEKKKTSKCTGCIDRVENGILPACAQTCQPGAIQFGEHAEMLAKAKARLEEVKKTNPKAQLYGDNLMGGTTYIYLLMDSPETYGLPVNPSASASLSLWQDYVQPYGGWLIPLAAAASVGSFFTTRVLKVMDSKSKGGDTHGA